jgi:hypothetical protein
VPAHPLPPPYLTHSCPLPPKTSHPYVLLTRLPSAGAGQGLRPGKARPGEAWAPSARGQSSLGGGGSPAAGGGCAACRGDGAAARPGTRAGQRDAERADQVLDDLRRGGREAGWGRTVWGAHTAPSLAQLQLSLLRAVTPSLPNINDPSTPRPHLQAADDLVIRHAVAPYLPNVHTPPHPPHRLNTPSTPAGRG